MSALLAVETSGTLCSLAIHAGGRWFEDTQNVERLHNRVVLRNLDRLVSTAAIHRRDIDVVAFGAGPGSFTGVRIAAAVAQGVAFGNDARVVPVRSSRALAAAARRHSLAAGASGVITATRSRRDAYYLAGYAYAGSPEGRPCLTQRLDDQLHQGELAPDPLPEPQWPGVGDRPPWWPRERAFLEDVAVTAVVVGEVALEMVAAGESVSVEAALPIYVVGDSPWRPMRS